MYAQKVIKEQDIVKATKNVIVYYKSSIYKADEAIYHLNNKVLELFGNVTNISLHSTSKTDYLKINMKTKDTKTKKFFIYDAKEGLWIRGSSYDSKNDIYIVRDSEVSSCDIKNPDWKILFSKGKYNKKREFLSLLRPTFYFKDIPIFALPWFGFSTIKKRTTGLLRPKLAIRADSGFIYMQPYFIAPSLSWDIELIPQIRLLRGYGLYGTLRFVDSPTSKGSITTGFFKDKSSFVKEKGLKNSTHKGFDFKYESRDFLKSYLKKSDKVGLYIDFKTLNDIDYENLKDINIKSFDKLVTSRLNYFIKRDQDYMGIYIKYFIDTDKANNSDTMQELPTLQYHRFTTNLPLKNLTYSIDYKFKNNYRQKGLNAYFHEINLPIKLTIPLFYNYINFSISENLYYSKIEYSKLNNQNMINAKYFSNYHKFILYTDLVKPYHNFLHNIQLQTTLQVPSFESKKGDFADFVSINKERKNFRWRINQYFYNNESNFLTIRSSQIIYLDKAKKEYGDISNDIVYYPNKNLKISENTLYSAKYNKFKRFQTNIDYNNDKYNFYLYHTHQKKLNTNKIDYLSGGFEIKLDHRIKIFGDLNYDMDKDLTRDWSVGVYRDKFCWNYQIKYKESITPISTSSGAKSYRNRGLYFLVNFANIGGISYEYTHESIDDSLKKDGVMSE